MPPRTRAGAAGGGDGGGDDEPTLLSIVELNKLFKDVVIFTPQSGVHDANKALFRAWTRSIMLHAPVLEIVGRHANREDTVVDGLERGKHRAALGRPAGPHHPGEHGQRPRRHRLPGHADHALAELRVRSPQQHATILESGV